MFVKTASAAACGDARVGLEILRKAGKKAEVIGSTRITKHEVKEAIREATELNKSGPLYKLNEHQKIIYKILEEKKKVPSGLLFKEYCKNVKNPVVDRAYRKYMEKMIELGLAKAEGKGRWKRYELIYVF